MQQLPCSLLTGPAAKKSGVVRLQLLSCSPLAGPVATKSHVYRLQLQPSSFLVVTTDPGKVCKSKTLEIAAINDQMRDNQHCP